MKRLLALIPAGLLALASFLPAYAAPVTSDPLLLAPKFIQDDSYVNIAANTATTTAFTYTVPNGRVFRMQLAKATVQQSATGALSQIEVNNGGGNVHLVFENPIGASTLGNYYLIDEVTGPIDYPAGTVFTGQYSNGNATTALQETLHLDGVEFNAP